ncbi:MotA/TolQ/ExbB proton channel family protein [Nitrosophilus kaiyonis]|uniref:MotA/TolQ/ExbB proton channel family protein n=1 Tax=Nitrosophilus kaiyonis TaxID=2930200 RepID=UPI002493A554|nr:MotA/TolQ/ExbB proton channel family protein [Nitrosophilus kaiyonis]
MRAIDILLDYIDRSSPVTIAVLILLSIYFILVNWIFFYRFFSIKSWIKKEEASLESLYLGSIRVAHNSVLNNCIKKADKLDKDILDFCKFAATKEATKGLTFLSIAASTSPFIGLFGTVISILEAFSMLGASKASIGVIAPAIGEALVATAAGIFVAVFAYSYHLFLKRKGFEVISLLQMQSDLLLSRR